MIALNVQSHQYLPVVIYKTVKSFMTSRQGRNDSIHNFYKAFCSHIQVVSEASGRLAIGDKLYDFELDELVATCNNGRHTAWQKMLSAELAKKAYLVIYLIMETDKAQYWKCLEDLEKYIIIGRYDCPTTLNDAYMVISNCRTSNASNKNLTGKNGVVFTLDGEELSEERISLLTTEDGDDQGDDDRAAARRK